MSESQLGLLICVMSLATTACGAEQPNSLLAPDRASCRTIASVSVVSTDTMSGNSRFHDEAQMTCRYDRAANQLVCTSVTIAAGTVGFSVTRSTYASLADFIDEAHVVPPRTFATSTVTEDPTRSSSRTTIDRVFDGAHRIMRDTTQFEPLALNPLRIQTYSAWDANLRPLTASRTDVSQTQVFTYNDATREVTQVVRSTPPDSFDSTCTTRFDTSGIRISRQCTSFTVSSITTRVISTEQVCQ